MVDNFCADCWLFVTSQTLNLAMKLQYPVYNIDNMAILFERLLMYRSHFFHTVWEDVDMK